MQLSAVFLLVLLNIASAQDTVRITLENAESLFLKKNFLLLASTFNIEKQKALIIQARAYPNPVFSAEINAYDPQNDKAFHIDQTGEKAFTLEQVILLGGKRKTEIEIAKQNTTWAEYQFADLLRNLQFRLRQSFFNINYYQNIIERYESQLNLLDTIIKSYEVQAAKNNVALKDVIRLKSAYMGINNSNASSYLALNEEIKNLRVLLQEKGIIVPDIKKEELQTYTKLPAVAELETNSLSKRPDLLGNDAMKKIAELNYLLERKRAIPDVNFMMSNDQRGGAFVNQTNIGLSVPLPTWNRNRGNIEAAQWEAKSADVLFQEKQNEIRQEVMQAYVNMDRSIKEYERANLYYTTDFENVFKAIRENFAKRNISVLEFLDFFEAYNIAVTEFERIRAQLGITAASMNFAAGYKVY